VLDRLSRDTYKYVQCCLLCLLEGLVEIVPLIFSAIAEELQIVLNGGKAAAIPSEFDRRIMMRSDFENFRAGNLVYVGILLDLMQAQCVKMRIVTPGFIKALATLIDASSEGAQFGGGEEFTRALLLIVESISSNQKLLLQLSESIIAILLPSLL
jgi:hypothetical protein